MTGVPLLDEFSNNGFKSLSIERTGVCWNNVKETSGKSKLVTVSHI